MSVPEEAVPFEPLERVESDQTQLADLQETQGSGLSRLENVRIAAGLSAVAIISQVAEMKGMGKELPSPIGATVNSMAHPVLGYMGAWMGVVASTKVGKISSRAYNVAGALAATIALDVASEGVQSVRGAGGPYENPVSTNNSFETAKDLGFALAGMGIFYYLNRRKSKTED